MPRSRLSCLPKRPPEVPVEVETVRDCPFRTQTNGDPVMLPPGKDAGGALSNVDTPWQIAWPFTPIDQDDLADFIERWLGWFADGIEGKLRHPHSMPERDTAGSYRT